MKQKNRSGRVGDPIVNAVLDQLWEVAQVDPTNVFPESKFGVDLGLTANQVKLVTTNAAKQIGISMTLEERAPETLTAGDLVEILRKAAQPRSLRSA